MTSLLTNTLASTTLRQMAVTQRDLAQAQGQAASGLRVANASDNAAYWSIGVAMKSQIGALSSVKDGLALSSSIATVTTSALKSIIGQINTIKNDLVTAQQPGVSLADVDLDIKAAQQQIITIANAASFNGQNWLVGQQKTDEVVHDTASYDTTQAVVRSVLNKTAVATTSFNATIQTQGVYTRTDASGATQSQTTDDTHVDTYTVTVTPHLPAPPTKVLSSSSVVTNSTAVVALAPVANDIHLVQGYGPANGANIDTISDAPLRLFTNNSGTVTETSSSSYAGGPTVDNNLLQYGKSEIVLTTSQAASYSGSAAGSAPGLLDGSLTVSNTTGGNKATILTMTTIGATGTDLGAMLDATDKALAGLTGAAAVVGGLQTRIDSQSAFTAALSDALTVGVGALTDADMNTTATRIQALQTQQQLQTQSLSIANQNSRSILTLFQ